MSLIDSKKLTPWILGILFCLTAALPSWGTTLQRASLETLVQHHEMIVVAEVTNTFSYWNNDHSMILTDVTLQPETALKGRTQQQPMTLTLLGGTVDDVTVAIIAGAQLSPGHSYLLFLDEATLDEGKRALTVREHSQGVFDFVLSEKGELRAVSQASRVPLLQDAQGLVEPPGGQKGLTRGDIFDAITTLVARGDQ